MSSKFAAIAGVIEYYRSCVSEANALGQRIIASRQDPKAAAESALVASDDAKIAQWREADAKAAAQIAAAQAARDANRTAALKYAAENLLVASEEGFDPEEAKTEFLAKRKSAHRMHETIQDIVGADAMQEVYDEFGIVEIIGLGAKGSGKGTTRGATGIKRPRIAAATVNGEAIVNEKGGATFGDIVDYVKKSLEKKVTVADLHRAAFEAAGTEDLSSLAAGTVVSFRLGDVDYTVTAQGREEEATEESTEESTEEETTTEA